MAHMCEDIPADAPALPGDIVASYGGGEHARQWPAIQTSGLRSATRHEPGQCLLRTRRRTGGVHSRTRQKVTGAGMRSKNRENAGAQMRLTLSIGRQSGSLREISRIRGAEFGWVSACTDEDSSSY